MSNNKTCNVITIDLKIITDTVSLYHNYPNELGSIDLSQHDGQVFFRALEQLAEMSTLLIIYNLKSYKKRCFYDSIELATSIYNYNCGKERDQIIYDEYENLLVNNNTKHTGNLFEREPSKYGYRGDIYLWKELNEYFINKTLPKNEDLLVDQIIQAITKLTNQSINNGKPFQVKKYNNGGITGGVINSAFWLNNLIPLVIGRYRKLKKNYKNGN